MMVNPKYATCLSGAKCRENIWKGTDDPFIARWEGGPKASVTLKEEESDSELPVKPVEGFLLMQRKRLGASRRPVVRQHEAQRWKKLLAEAPGKTQMKTVDPQRGEPPPPFFCALLLLLTAAQDLNPAPGG